MSIEQDHERYTLEQFFRTAVSDWGSIEATMLSGPVRRTHVALYVFEVLAM
jgi:hypothetical protein